MWTAVSILLLLIIESFWVKSKFVLAISLIIIPLTSIMYVDNTNLFLNAPPQTSYIEIGKRAQSLVNKWCDYLWITGGCLRPDKCTWSMMTFKWDKDGNRLYRMSYDTPFEILVPDDKKKPYQIRRCKVNEGVRGLGVYLSPSRSNATQVAVMKKNQRNGPQA